MTTPLILPRGLVLLVGPPAAGKSTFARRLVELGRLDAAGVVSADAIRAARFGPGIDERDDPAVFDEVDARIAERLTAGQPVLLDATNVRRVARLRARRHGGPAAALRFPADEATLLARNDARMPAVPVPMLLRLLAVFEAEATLDQLHREDFAVVSDAPDPATVFFGPPAADELRTARLSLRRPVPADIDAIYRLHTDPRACAHNPGDLIASRSEAEDRYRHWDTHWRRHGFGYWTVHRHDGGLLGFCGIKLMPLHDQTVLNLFYRLDPAAWGDGVATEAATAVATWAAAHRPDDLLVARVRPANTASRKVAERIGLRRAPHLDTEGEDGPDLIFSSGPA